MSQVTKTEEISATASATQADISPTTTQVTTPPTNTEAANPAPEATPEKSVAPVQTPVTTTEEPVVATQEVVVEPVKTEEKAEESPRTGLLKGFQQRLAGVFPKKSEKATEKSSENKEEKKEEKKSHTEEKKEEKEEEKEKEKEKSSKQRSVSRKRNSLLGGFGIGKKEDKATTDESHVADTTSATAEQSKTPEPAADKTAEPESTPAPETVTDRPGLSKRTSIFDTFKSHFVKKDKSEPNSATKETEVVSDSAPVIPAVGTTETTAVEPVVVEETPEVAPEAKPEKPVTKFEKRKSSLPFGLGLNKKEKAHSSDDEVVEKPLSPFAKLRATVKSKASPKFSSDKKEESATAETKVQVDSAKPAEATKPEPSTNAAPVVAASA